MQRNDIYIKYSEASDTIHSQRIHEMYKEAASGKDIGLAVRSASYLNEVITAGKGIFAFYQKELAGFCYIETWEHEKYLANSGLIVLSKYRGMGIAKSIKQHAFELSGKLYPHAKLFGLTTNSAVMRINAELGYVPVTFSKLTQDPLFWEGCESCPNFDILMRMKRKNCLCTAMIFDPDKPRKNYEHKTYQKQENRSGI
jgi:GNAT superfamily N-acetyltransferase